MTDPGLSELVQACRRGEEAGFAELYRLHADGLFHLSLRVLGNHEDATDALQETFLQAFRRFSTYRGEGSLKSWLYRVGLRVCFRMRRRRKTALSLDEEETPPASVDPEPVPERDFQEALQQAVQRLPERARLVFLMHTTEGMTHAEIAQVLEVTEGTSKSQLNYARSLLKQRLARWCHELS